MSPSVATTANPSSTRPTIRRLYLDLLGHHAVRSGARLLGYCLMTNHVHLIVVPEREDSLARGLGQAHCRYAHCVNARRRSTGHLWQNRFYSTVMDEVHLLAAMRYVERNPVRAGMVASVTTSRKRSSSHWPLAASARALA